MWKLTRRHPDDEALIAHLDGELAGRAGRRVASHLKACWECRTRLAHIEDQIRCLAEAREARIARVPWALAASRERLMARLDALAERTPPKLSLPRPRWSLAWAWAAATVAVIAGTFLWLGRQPDVTGPSAPEALARTRAAENELLASPVPVHQVFRVEAGKDTSRLEVWSDVSGRRYASRWRDESGTLRCALWRPGTGQEFTYVRNTTGPPKSGSTAPVYLVQVATASLEQFERAFFAWLESHRWRPLSLTAELAQFAGEAGTSLEVQRIPGGLRLTARRRLAEAVLEIDDVSHRPRMLSLRSGDVTLRLISETAEAVTVAPASAFRPDVPLPGPTPSENVARVAPRAPLPTPEELDESEVRVLYALHQAGSCHEDEVQLVRQAPGSIEARGQVASSERKRRLAVALGSIPHVVARIQSAEEGAKPARQVVVQQVNVQVRRSAIADRLEEFLRGRFPDNAHVRAGEISDGAVSAAHAALSEAWALRRLAEWATAEKVERMSPESSRLLTAMVRHHSAALRDRAAGLDNLVRPALSAIAGSPPDPAPGFEARDWQGASAAIFDAVDRLERLTVSLFARAGSNARETEETGRSLLGALDGIDVSLDALDSRLAQAR